MVKLFPQKLPEGSIYLRPDKVLHKNSEGVHGDSDLERCPWDTLEDDLGDVKTPEQPLTTEPQTLADNDGLPSTSSGASAMDQERTFLVLPCNTSMFTTLWDVKEPTHLSQRVGRGVPGVLVWSLCYFMIHGLGG